MQRRLSQACHILRGEFLPTASKCHDRLSGKTAVRSAKRRTWKRGHSGTLRASEPGRAVKRQKPQLAPASSRAPRASSRLNADRTNYAPPAAGWTRAKTRAPRAKPGKAGPPPRATRLAPGWGRGCGPEDFPAPRREDAVRTTPASTAGVPELTDRVQVGSRSLTSALGCLKVSKNSSSMDESTAMFAAGGGRGDDFRGSSPTSQAEARGRGKRRHFR